MNNSGEVLAFSGNDEKNIVDIVSAITSNMWLITQSWGEAALNEDYLNFILIKCEVSTKKIKFTFFSLKIIYLMLFFYIFICFRMEKFLLEE